MSAIERLRTLQVNASEKRSNRQKAEARLAALDSEIQVATEAVCVSFDALKLATEREIIGAATKADVDRAIAAMEAAGAAQAKIEASRPMLTGIVEKLRASEEHATMAVVHASGPVVASVVAAEMGRLRDLVDHAFGEVARFLYTLEGIERSSSMPHGSLGSEMRGEPRRLAALAAKNGLDIGATGWRVMGDFPRMSREAALAEAERITGGAK